MKRIILIVISVFLMGGMQLKAQDGARTVLLNATTNDSIIPGPGNGINIYDDGGATGSYTGGYDMHLTILGECPGGDSVEFPPVLCLEVQPGSYDIAAGDTLYFYDGPSITSPLIAKFSHNYQSSPGSSFFITSNNTSNMMTVRFRTRNPNEQKPAGFKITVSCMKPCEFVKPVIDSAYEHVIIKPNQGEEMGKVVARRKMQSFPDMIDTIFALDTIQLYDTIWKDSTHTEYYNIVPRDTVVHGDILGYDTVSYIPGMTSCIGLGIRLHGHGEYTNNTGYYTPNDMTSKFIWLFENLDSLYGTGLTQVTEDQLDRTGCTKVFLTIIDEHGCQSHEQVMVQIRVAQNPIKTLFSLNSICNNSYYPVSVGVNDENSTLNLKLISFDETYTKTYEVRTFIPDGKCPRPGEDVYKDECFMAPVHFEEFPAGRKVQSAGDICSICVNYEHSYMGDYRIAITCPTWDRNNPMGGGMAVLKWGKLNTGGGTCDPDATADNSPDGSSAGSGVFTGVPIDGSGAHMPSGSDDATGANDKCDSLLNPFGIGFDYCWSRNGEYTLVSGESADYPAHLQQGSWYISSSGNMINVTDADVTWRPMPAHMASAGMIPGIGSNRHIQTKKPSDHEGKRDYYSPASDFSELIGCPLNGDWNIMVCDWWSADNGWVFNWSLDICGVASGSGDCVYQVAIDSVTWRPDTNYATDYRDGVYKGLRIEDMDSTTAHILSPDTSGTFPIRLKIYDEFGCIWDTNTSITTIHQPLPSLGPDITICSADSIKLNAYDNYKGFNYNYTYMWEPYGQETPTVYTRTNEYGLKRYIVEVKNTYHNPVGGVTTCRGRDTINVTINEQPILSFDPGVYPLEGCEPFTLKVKNSTKYGDKYRWEFGDGVIQTVKEPTHTYGAGQYTLKYYVESNKGCKDSLIFDSLVTVFPYPKAAFSWEPEFPTVTRPQVSFVNNTTPHTDANKYFWEIQYHRDHPNSFATKLERNPVYTWTPKDGEDITGDYTVRLIARTDNYGPSGRLIQCADTVESTILIINDNIHFPTVVTPNGDGYNDRFVIQGLVEGLGYQINTLDIYDKWGSRVFHADNIKQDDQFWDPAKTNSPTGTYFYRFIGRGQAGTMERNGVVEVLR